MSDASEPEPQPERTAAANLRQAVQNLVAQNPQAAQVPAQQLAAAVPGRGRGRGAGRGRGRGRGGASVFIQTFPGNNRYPH
jgi:plasmid stabilization system protein ParE